jgi:hypothetical protein
LKIKFAQGIALEHLKGKDAIDWAAFGQKTNNMRRFKIEGMKQKLHHCKNKRLEVSWNAWRKMKVKKSTPSGLGGATHSKWVNCSTV